MTEIPNRTKLSPTEAAALVCGLLPTLLGGVVLAGWYLGNKTLIQVSPDFVPMQYNTALGFVVGGAGLLCTISSSRVAIRIFGAMAAAIGLLTLIQYVFGAELGIDQLFMEHYITVETSHPGRMAPNTALCFSLTGIALLIAGRAGETTWTWPAVAVLGSLVLGLGVVAFSGYAMRLETAYGWGNLTRMAVHTSAGFIVLGLGLFWHAWHKERASVADLPYWFPAPVGIVTLTITLSLWQALDREELASHLILAFGVLLSGAFAYTVRLAQGLRRRARELEREVEERIKAEQELEDGRADLERTVEARTQELEISQERFALSIRGSGDGIWEFDPGRRENWYSSRFEEMLGYAEGEIPNTLEASIELLHPEDREAANEGFIRHLKDDTPYDIEYRLRTKSGDYRWVRARAKSLRDANGRATRTSGSTTDIDEQKQAEERLLRNERQFVMILEAAPVGVTVTDSKSKRVVVNQRYADIVGIPRDELLGSSAANVWAREEDRAEYARRFAEDNRVVDMEFEMKRSDGSSAWVMANAISLDFFGEPVRVNWVVELTDRKETEEALRESETRLLEILDQSPYGVSIVSRKTKQRLYGNRRMKEMVAGGPDVALDGREIADSYAEPEKMEENWALFERDGMITGTEELRKHANGSTWWCLSDWRPVKFGDEDAVMVWHYDITERTEAAEALQKALRQAEQFNKLTVDRELRMIEMKKEVDELLEKLGEEARYSGL